MWKEWFDMNPDARRRGDNEQVECVKNQASCKFDKRMACITGETSLSGTIPGVDS